MSDMETGQLHGQKPGYCKWKQIISYMEQKELRRFLAKVCMCCDKNDLESLTKQKLKTTKKKNIYDWQRFSL